MTVSPVVAGGDGAEVFKLVEESLDGIALPVKPVAVNRRIDPPWHGADFSRGSAFGKALAKGSGIIDPVRQENGSGLYGVQHILGASPVMGQTFGELQGDGRARTGRFSDRVYGYVT